MQPALEAMLFAVSPRIGVSQRELIFGQALLASKMNADKTESEVEEKEETEETMSTVEIEAIAEKEMNKETVDVSTTLLTELLDSMGVTECSVASNDYPDLLKPGRLVMSQAWHQDLKNIEPVSDCVAPAAGSFSSSSSSSSNNNIEPTKQ